MGIISEETAALWRERAVETDLTDARPDDGYPSLLEVIKKEWNEAATVAEPIFTTAAGGTLFSVFLANLPEEARQYYNCNACCHFMARYGGLVRIDKNTGELTPVMWPENVDGFFAPAIAAVRNKVLHSRVTGMFLTPLKKLGTPKTGQWTHMAVEVPRHRRFNERLKTADQRMAEVHQDFEILWHAIDKYKVETAETAVNLLIGTALARAEKIRPQARWFLDVLRSKPDKGCHRNVIWYKAATAPTGYCHVPGSVLGSLMDDIQEGMDFEAIKNRFNAKMDPLQYQRPQVAPGAQNVRRAEKIVAELGLENSLKRRYARVEELLQVLWKPRVDIHKTAPSSGIFGHILTKERTRTTPTNRVSAPAITMTWDKFQRTVLPTAKKIEFKVPHGKGNYGAIATAVDPEAPPIVAWDKEDSRNPFSWYVYASGSLPSHWNLSSATYVEVTAVTAQPNMWTPGFGHCGQGVFFILKGARDMRPGGLGLFPEILRGDLHEVRATIEAFSREGKMEGAQEATACGVVLPSDMGICKWGTLRVTTDVGVQEYILDRWD